MNKKSTNNERENTSASTTGGGSISVPARTAPAAGSSAIFTGPTGAGGAGSSAIEERLVPVDGDPKRQKTSYTGTPAK